MDLDTEGFTAEIIGSYTRILHKALYIYILEGTLYKEQSLF